MMDLTNFFDELLVVIVLFETKPQDSEAYTSLQTVISMAPSSPDIFIYDNSHRPSSITGDSITYFHDGANSGVSRACNKAAIHGGNRNKKWMLLLDQDTQVTSVFFQKSLESLTEYPATLAFVPLMTDVRGLLSPFYFASASGRRLKKADSVLSLERYRFINSGLLIRHSAFTAAGGYDEKIPLDFSDISFGERLQKVTDHFRVIDVPLQHGFADHEKVPIEKALHRFQYFCAGALVMGRIYGLPYLYFIRTLLHAVRLSFRYKNFRFISRLFQLNMHG